MTRRQRDEGHIIAQAFKVAAALFFIGTLMFVHAWWPIQAERLRLQLKKSEAQVFQKKIELNALKERYGTMTSLVVLDQWAKKNGPWVSPQAENVIPINI